MAAERVREEAKIEDRALTSHGGKEVSVNSSLINSAQSLCDSIT